MNAFTFFSKNNCPHTLGQVLGSRFVLETSQGEPPLLAFGEEQEPEGRPLYAIRDADWTAADFRSIYQPTS